MSVKIQSSENAFQSPSFKTTPFREETKLAPQMIKNLFHNQDFYVRSLTEKEVETFKRELSYAEDDFVNAIKKAIAAGYLDFGSFVDLVKDATKNAIFQGIDEVVLEACVKTIQENNFNKSFLKKDIKRKFLEESLKGIKQGVSEGIAAQLAAIEPLRQTLTSRIEQYTLLHEDCHLRSPTTAYASRPKVVKIVIPAFTLQEKLGKEMYLLREVLNKTELDIYNLGISTKAEKKGRFKLLISKIGAIFSRIFFRKASPDLSQQEVTQVNVAEGSLYTESDKHGLFESWIGGLRNPCVQSLTDSL